MPYLIKDENGNIKEAPVVIKRSNDHKVYYAHGAQGGILGSYHYRIDFYREDIPASTNAKEIGGKLTQDTPEIVREIDASVYISLPFAKQLRDWLNKNITQYEIENGEIIVASGKKPEGIE